MTLLNVLPYIQRNENILLTEDFPSRASSMYLSSWYSYSALGYGSLFPSPEYNGSLFDGSVVLPVFCILVVQWSQVSQRIVPPLPGRIASASAPSLPVIPLNGATLAPNLLHHPPIAQSSPSPPPLHMPQLPCQANLLYEYSLKNSPAPKSPHE
jgi:hypothetical protein